jgi:uncharacterized protein YceK
MKKLILIIWVLISIAGCRTIRLMNHLSVGMSKSEAIRVMGEPDITGANGNEEYMRYDLAGDSCYISLIDGKVASFGRWGDFNSTKDPTLNIRMQK